MMNSIAATSLTSRASRAIPTHNKNESYSSASGSTILLYDFRLSCPRRTPQALAQLAAHPDDLSEPDALLMTQHGAVFTLGTGSTLDNLKFAPDEAPFDVVRTERGGEVTYHGPGQVSEETLSSATKRFVEERNDQTSCRPRMMLQQVRTLGVCRYSRPIRPLLRILLQEGWLGCWRN